MKRICFVTTIYMTYKAFLKNLSIYLHDTGEYDISLICADEQEAYEDVPDFVHYFPVKMERGVSLSMFESIKQIQVVLEKEKFDIVQYSTPNAAFYTSIAAKKAKAPVRLYCQWGIRYMGFEGWKRVLFKKLEKITCDNSTFIEVESDNIREFSLKEKLYTADRSCVIWNGSASGVDLSKFDISKKEQWNNEIRTKYGISENDIVFSFAARLTADKGINELLEAFTNLVEKYDNIKLLVMGGMDDSGSINNELVKIAKNSGKAIFTGSVPDVERYYAASDVFVAPSYREGFGLVVIEAESMALPAIVSNVPGQIDAIVPNETGLDCVVKSASSLQEKMEKLILDTELRKRLGANAQKFVEDNFEQKKLFEYLKKHRDELIGE
ncbi:glycosyltransferase [Eubacterium coprostanoligenes]|uniref:glycosyltransferase n=1 Tax=Eubacterium coprostanoligenes TaxID=290054 RepID=UPI002353D670|nr:glycosyltransferase [Eubacterium coprostanoligenes]MCI6253614.1 glycosyltransferase [Eubacterium coprostanoligenes]MDY5399326.1 glycosyltransferase [Eubacterium coprostanoligenes]